MGPPLAHIDWSHPAVGPAQTDGLMIEKAGRKIGVIGLVDPSLVPADLGVESLRARIQPRLPTWIEDYNQPALHSALGMRSPANIERC